MTEIKSEHLLVLLCALSLSVFFCDVDAKVIKRAVYNSSYGLSGSYSKNFTHQSIAPSIQNKTSPNRLYPPAPKNSLSGSSSSSDRGTQSGFYSRNFTRPGNRSSGLDKYPSPEPNSLSGSGKILPTNHPLISSGSKTGSTPIVRYNQTSRVNSTSSSRQSNSSNSTSKRYTEKPSKGTTFQTGKSNTYVKAGDRAVVPQYHYVYQPPKAIRSQNISYPIFTGTPPSYVYQYKSSGSKYSNLLSGLALYNLGRMSATPNSYQYHTRYVPQVDEYCTFIIKYNTGKTREMAIDCRVITYFIYEDEPQLLSYMTKNIVNQTIMTSQSMLPNGILIMPAYAQNQNSVPNGIAASDSKPFIGIDQRMQQVLTSDGRVVSYTQNDEMKTQVMSVTDPQLAGHPVTVIPEMECFVTRHARNNHMNKQVSCELLQTYSTSSLRRSSSAMIKSYLIVTVAALIFVLNFNRAI